MHLRDMLLKESTQTYLMSGVHLMSGVLIYPLDIVTIRDNKLKSKLAARLTGCSSCLFAVLSEGCALFTYPLNVIKEPISPSSPL